MKIMKLACILMLFILCISMEKIFTMEKGEQPPDTIKLLLPVGVPTACVEEIKVIQKTEHDVFREEIGGVVTAFNHAPRFHQHGLPLPSPLCLWGPEGVGKTHTAVDIVSQLQGSYIQVSSEEILYNCLDPKNIVPIPRLLEEMNRLIGDARRQTQNRKKIASLIISNIDKLFHPDINFLEVFSTQLYKMIKQEPRIELLLIGETRSEPSPELKAFFRKIIQVPIPLSKNVWHYFKAYHKNYM